MEKQKRNLTNQMRNEGLSAKFIYRIPRHNIKEGKDYIQESYQIIRLSPQILHDHKGNKRTLNEVTQILQKLKEDLGASAFELS